MAVQIGELRARLLVEAEQMKQEIREVKKGIADLGDESKKTSKSFTDLNSAISRIAANSDHLKSIEQQLKKMDPSKLEQGLSAIVAELKAMGAEKKQIEALEKALAEMAQQAQQADVRVGQLENEVKTLNERLRDTNHAAGKAGQGLSAIASGLSALGAGAALNKLVSTVNSLANEANQLASSYRGLAVVAEKFNVDAEEAANLADRLADRWGLNKGVLADVVKTYLTMNLTLEETERIITATADAAAYNRQAHLSWDEAIKQVAEGIKAGNSNLTDAAGITTNLSVMYERYAKTIGKTAATLTEAEKIQAAYNGMLEEGAIFAGNADDAMTGLTGTQAAFNSTLQMARVELGEAFIPAVQSLLETLTPIIRDFALWTEANRDVVVGLTAAAAAVTGFIALLGALSAAIIAVNVAMGPIGWAILGIGALAAGVIAYTAAVNAAAREQEKFNELIEKSPMNRQVQEVKDMQDHVSELNRILSERNRLMTEYEKVMKDVEQGRVAIENSAIPELTKSIRALDAELSKMGYTAEEAEQAVKDLNAAIDKSVPALLEMNRAERLELQTKIEKINQVKDLRARYEELTASEERNEAQNAELRSVVEQLAREYPQLNKYIDEKNQIHSDGISILDEAIGAEERYYGRKAELLQEDLRRMRETATAEKALIDARIAQLDEFAKKAEAAPDNLPAYARMANRTSARLADEEAERARATSDALALAIAEIDAAIAGTDIREGRGKGIGGALPPETTASTSGEKTKTRAEIELEQYRESRKLIDYKRNLGRLNEQQEIAELDELLKKYQHNADIRMELEVAIHRLKEQMAADEEKRLADQLQNEEKAAAARFRFSADWIQEEERRMRLAGESEEKIAQMKLEAWSRVRSRYEKNSEYYKRADTELYNIRIDIIKKTQKAEEEAAKEREKQAKEVSRISINEIEKAKRAELDALDERRKAIQQFYDSQVEAIDDAERLKERNELIAEMEKYRFATSEKGQKHFQELQERLREMDVEDQKRSLEKQRDQELESLERQKTDIESYYNDLRDATSELTGDLTALYKLADDERLQSFVNTNEKIKTEMANLLRELEAASAPQTATQTMNGIVQSVIAQMRANSLAWHTADEAGKQRLAAENQALGAQIGATYNAKEGRWYLDGAPLYHSGGIAGELHFRSPELLMPDEITAILRRAETVLTPQQVGSLVGAQANGPTIHIEKFMEVNDPVFEDGIDLRAFGREAGGEAAEVLRQQFAKGESA